MVKYAYKPNRNPLFVSVWGRLIKSEIVNLSSIRFLEELTTFEDVLFNFELLNNVESVVYVPTLGYHYTIHPDYNSASMVSANDNGNLFGFVKAIQALEKTLIDNLGISKSIAHKATSSALVSYTIIQTIRLCRGLSLSKYFFIRNIVSSSWLRDSLRYYRPTGSDSKIIPIFFKYKLSLLILFLSYNKYNKRYKSK